MKKYAVVGSHGVGKSTFCKKLVEKCVKDFGKTKHIHSIQEVARDCPFPLNEKSSVDGGMWIVSKQLSLELEAKADGADILICDRSLFDPIIYLIAGDRFPTNTFSNLYTFARSLIPTYERIIFLRANWDNPIVDDGFRDLDKRFQMIVNDRFESFLKNYQSEFVKEIIYTDLDELMDEENFERIYNDLFWSE